MSKWQQKTIKLSPKRRGFTLVTDEILEKVPEIREYSIGIAHLFLQHTSASISINENCDRDVRNDMEMIINRIVPEVR